MIQKDNPAFVCCGRPITHQEINEIQETVSLFSNLSRKELTQTICEHLNWHTAAGANKIDACMKMLEKSAFSAFYGLKNRRTAPSKIHPKNKHRG